MQREFDKKFGLVRVLLNVCQTWDGWDFAVRRIYFTGWEHGFPNKNLECTLLEAHSTNYIWWHFNSDLKK